jgi:N-glycosylase/DNA lyase
MHAGIVDVRNKYDDGSGRKLTGNMHTITLLPHQDFSLDRTLSCGQVFRWEYKEGWWRGIVGGRVIRVRQERDTLAYEGASRNFLRHYFALDENLDHILRAIIEKDTGMQEVIEASRGLRIVRQDPWECTLSYLIATFSNIPTIQRRIEALARALGNMITAKGETGYGFPGPEAFSGVCRTSLEVCRLGYRGPYLQETACRLASDPGWEDRIRTLSYEEGRKELMRLRGIGPKAADCILLFAFQRYESFPVDVWIQRIMQERFPVLKRQGSEVIRRFGQEHFGAFAGYAQEYLYAARQVPTSQASR